MRSAASRDAALSVEPVPGLPRARRADLVLGPRDDSVLASEHDGRARHRGHRDIWRCVDPVGLVDQVGGFVDGVTGVEEVGDALSRRSAAVGSVIDRHPSPLRT